MRGGAHQRGPVTRWRRWSLQKLLAAAPPGDIRETAGRPHCSSMMDGAENRSTHTCSLQTAVVWVVMEPPADVRL